MRNRISFLAENIQTYSLIYCVSLMFGVPKVWLDFEANSWRRLTEQLVPRPDPSDWDLSELFGRGEYADIFFLIRFLKLDALHLVLGDSRLNLSERKKIIIYVGKNASVLMNDGIALKTDANCLPMLEDARQRLIDEDELLTPDYTDGISLAEHALELIQQLDR